VSTFILPDSFAHFTLYWRSANSPKIALTTFAAGMTSPPLTQTQCNSILTDIVGALDQDWDSQTSWPQLVTLANVGGTILRFVSTSTVTGTHAAFEECPSNVAALVAKATGLAGRRNRGRFFLPFIDESRVDASGRLSSAYQTALQAVADALYGVFHGDTGRPLGPVALLHSEAPSTATNVTAFQLQPIVATQRRRLVRATV
jgi:hypothetical protein